MSRSRIDGAAVALAGTLVLGAILAGCSDIYYDRRETVALGANDAVETNKVTQIVDPWPRHVENRKTAFNGERMQAAVERYRQNRVTPLNLWNTSSSTYQQSQAPGGSAATVATPTAPAAPVK